MNQLQVRCPSCSKLYAIDSIHIQAIRDHKAAPCIQCVQCPIVFSFEVPAKNEFKEILDSQPWTPQLEFEDAATKALDDQVPAALQNQWLVVIEKFPVKTVHLQFLGDCKNSGHLEFALRRYKKLDEILGNDPLCKEMIHSIEGLLKPVIRVEESPAQKLIQFLIPLKVYLPFVIGGTMIFGGLVNSAHRNMVGLGIVICIIGYLFARRQTST